MNDGRIPVWFAVHKSFGIHVAIKAIPNKEYRQQTMSNRIEEAEALELCQESLFVSRLVETFTEDGMTYIVTKFVPSCDLLTYM